MSVRAQAVGVAMVLSMVGGGDAEAQVLGSFSWQLQPFCNVVTVRVTLTGAVYTLDGYDNQCGAPQRAPLVGMATPNPDGSIGLGLQIVTVPGGRLVSVDARVPFPALTGTWSDSAGNSGTFVFNGVTPGLPARPAPAGGPQWGTTIDAPPSPGTAGLVVRNPDTVSASPAPAISAQVGGPAAVPGTRSAAVVGESAGRPGVLGVSGSSTGVLGTSSTGSGVIGLTFSPTSPAVFAATAAVGGVALQLDGAVRVSGPARPVFQHIATAPNISGSATLVDHVLLNGRPEALVFVQHVNVPGVSNLVTGGFAVRYVVDEARWAIFREDAVAMPVNARFNVLVVSQ